MATGEASGVFVIDIDGPEGEKSWAQLVTDIPEIPAETLEQRTGSGGRHLFFKWPSREVRNKQNVLPKIDVRGEGGYVVVSPSIHPNGEEYEWPNGMDTQIEAAPDALLDLLTPTTKGRIKLWDKQPGPKPDPETSAPARSPKPQVTPILERASCYLRECAPAIQGQGGHDALLWAARAMVVGFELSDAEALSLLWSEFNPQCSPPWDWSKPSEVKDFERKVTEVRQTPGKKPSGWLLDQYNLQPADERLSSIGDQTSASLLTSHHGKEGASEESGDECSELDDEEIVDIPDPGYLPPHLFNVPGFIKDVMEYCMETAPYPNRPLAFAGALALMSLLAARKVRDEGDMRTNIYLIVLAPSGSGKDWPRKLNKDIAYKCSFMPAMGDRFASGQGIEDALLRVPAKLFQTDEIDTLFQTLNKARDPLTEELMAMLLTLYGESSSQHIMRVKAGQERSEVIHQPSFTLFGTAIPVHFYSALNERLLTNGILSRTIIIDSGAVREGQEARYIDAPDHIVNVAKWWCDSFPSGKESCMKPKPITVSSTSEAGRILTELRNEADEEWSSADESDETARVVWSRVNEQGRKLALLYAVSENHRNPVIREDAAKWGADFAKHQARRVLALVGRYGATSEFMKDCRKMFDHLSNAPGRRLSRSKLMRKMKHLTVKKFDEIIHALEERKEINREIVPTKGRPRIDYVAKRQKRR